MIQLETSPPDRARVIGALTGAALKMLFERVKAREVGLDLSQVSEADVEALQLLARLPPERCDLFASPKWLALRIEMERRFPPSAVAEGSRVARRPWRRVAGFGPAVRGLVPYDRKSVSGVPLQGPARQPVDLAAQARVARARLWPPTLVYGIASAVVIALAVGRHGLRACLPWVTGGILIWTWVEYLAHRFVLHGVFPNGPGFWRRLLHRRFDHLHWHHHREPWNGRHISGTLRDTGPFVAVFAALAAVAPVPAAPVLVAAFMVGYVIEEWVHLSVHFSGWRGRYFRSIRRHHMYHHGAIGRDLAFGLTSDAWDRLYGTQVPVPAGRGRHRPGEGQALATLRVGGPLRLEKHDPCTGVQVAGL